MNGFSCMCCSWCCWGLHWNKILLHMPYTSVVSCCVVFPAAQAGTMSLKTGPPDRDESSEMKASWKSWPVATATETLCSRKPPISPLHCRNPVRLYVLQHHITVQASLSHVKLPFLPGEGQDNVFKVTPPWGRSLSAAAARTLAELGAGSGLRTRALQGIPGLTRVTQGYVSLVSDPALLCSRNKLSSPWTFLMWSPRSWHNGLGWKGPKQHEKSLPQWGHQKFLLSLLFLIPLKEHLNIKLVRKCSSFLFFLLLFFSEYNFFTLLY